MTTIVNNDLWRAVIEKFRSLPQLWKVKSEAYKNRNLRTKGWEELLVVYREVEPEATIDSLRKRIANMRTCYRRELKKKEKSEKSGTGDDDVYEPSLWFFDDLEFLRDQETQLPGISSIDNEENSGSEDEASAESKRKRSSKNSKDAYLKAAVDHLEWMKSRDTQEKDEAGAYSESWTVAFRKLRARLKNFWPRGQSMRYCSWVKLSN